MVFFTIMIFLDHRLRHPDLHGDRDPDDPPQLPDGGQGGGAGGLQNLYSFHGFTM